MRSVAPSQCERAHQWTRARRCLLAVAAAKIAGMRPGASLKAHVLKSTALSKVGRLVGLRPRHRPARSKLQVSDGPGCHPPARISARKPPGAPTGSTLGTSAPGAVNLASTTPTAQTGPGPPNNPVRPNRWPHRSRRVRLRRRVPPPPSPRPLPQRDSRVSVTDQKNDRPSKLSVQVP